jgi:hypothetical protein
MGAFRIRKRSPRQPTANVMYIDAPVYSYTFGDIVVGLIKSAALYAVYIGATALYLATHPPWAVRWWELAILIDLIAFAFVPMLCFCEGYRQYTKHKPKNSHSPTDYFVGLVLSVLLISGAGVHFLILLAAPDFEIWPSP